MAERDVRDTRRPHGDERALPRADRITAADRRTRALRRWRSRLDCLVGRHLWARHCNPEVGGSRAVYHLCRRCGRERSRRMPAWEYFAA